MAARRTLLTGGQRSGKSAHAESLAAAWLAASPAHRAVFVATALPHGAEMQARIERHRADRARRLPGVATVEAPYELHSAIAEASTPDTLVVVDCLTLWLTQQLMPPDFTPKVPESRAQTARAAMLLEAIDAAPGPLVLVTNEIGLGVIPLGEGVRDFVDALGRLNQAVAARCDRVALLVAGRALELPA